MKPPDQHPARRAIWIETVALLIFYCAAITWTSRYLLTTRISSTWLAIAIGFCLVQCTVIIVLLTGLMLRKQWFILLKAKGKQVDPLIMEHLAAVALGAGLPAYRRTGEFVDYEHAAENMLTEDYPTGTLGGLGAPDTGMDVPNTDMGALYVGKRKQGPSFSDMLHATQDLAEVAGEERVSLDALRDLKAHYPRQFESCAVRFLPSVSGEARQRLARLLTEMGLVAQWQRQYKQGSAAVRRQAIVRLSQLGTEEANSTLAHALDDTEIFIRIEAARGLIRSGNRAESERVFFFLATQPLMVQSLLVVDLMPCALELSEDVLPKALQSPDPEVVLMTLKFIEAWGRTLPLRGFGRVLASEDVTVRAQAYRAVAFVAMQPEEVGDAEPDIDTWLRQGLADVEPTVRAAAARSAGHLGSLSLLPPLEEALQDAETPVVVAAAFSLAARGDEGIAILQRVVGSSSTIAASAALEAIEKQQTGRLEMAS